MKNSETNFPKMGRPNKLEGQKSTKDKIFDIAIDLFADKGYKGTSIREIANAIGLTEGAVYRHFSSKDEILERIFAYAKEQIYTPLPIEQTLGTLQGQSIFRGLLEPLPKIIMTDPYLRKIERIMFNEMNQNEKVGQYYLNEYINKSNDYMIDLFEKCIEVGSIRPCDVKSLALIFNSFRNQWAYHNFIVNKTESLDLDKVKKELEDVIVFFENTLMS